MRICSVLLIAWLLSVWTLVAIADTPTSNFQIDPGVVAAFPIPAGLTPITDLSSPVFADQQGDLKSGPMALIVGLFEPRVIDAVAAGKSVTADQFMVFVQPKDPAIRSMSLNGFQQLVAVYRSNIQKAEAQISSNAVTAKQANIPGVTQSVRSAPVIVIDESNAYGASVRTTLGKAATPVITSTIFMLIKGHFITLTAVTRETSAKTQDAVKVTLANYVSTILKANGEPEN
jgi:hypothetical protein